MSEKESISLDTLRHSTAHVMAQAVKDLFGDVKLAIGPAIEDGFYYDFDAPVRFTEEDLEKIEKRMQEIIDEDLPFERQKMNREEAIEFFKELDEPYKVELLEEMDDDTVTLYRQGYFVDLCRGPHIPSTGKIGAFKLLSLAGAYWRGDERNKMLQRIYGTAFFDKKSLRQYLRRLEEAKKRDHRKLGKELDLFSVSEDVGPGLVHWHPMGARIRNIIETFWRDSHYEHGYELLYTPHIGRSELWQRSGHLDFYKEGMYAPMEIDEQDYYVKPMNCPFHIQIYNSQIRSYRDLPLRWAELGTVYRYEKSGVLHGLLRVRGFTQDDAHIFCTPEQIEDEILEVLRFSLYLWRCFGFEDITAYLATRPEKSVGEPKRWEQAQISLEKAVAAEGLDCKIDIGGGAFYGPKIDLKIRDAIGREWQTTTIQFDFNLPERFDMTYMGADGERHRPYMVHRALLGSLERFFGILVEHYAGAFPLWLAPVQARVMTITDRQVPFAKEVVDQLKKARVRAEADFRNEKLGFKIREAQVKKIPYALVIGDREVENRQVAPRARGNRTLPAMDVEAFISLVREECQVMGKTIL
ncbi:MAG: threonine--tRNA ligase [Deltaproteobacteria bacterium]|nr:threonine--tRNA ligase [Deltaproteobacteria bacterium]